MRKTFLLAGLGLLAFAAPSSAELHPLQHVDLRTPQRRTAEYFSTQAVNALVEGDAGRACMYAERGLAADPKDPWLHYNRAVALFDLGFGDQGARELNLADLYLSPGDTWGLSVVQYQRALRLQQAGRCDDARREFGRYARMVRGADPKAAELAIRYGNACVRPQPVATEVPPSERVPVFGGGQRQRAGRRDMRARPREYPFDTMPGAGSQWSQ
jgi:hypothetical protein